MTSAKSIRSLERGLTLMRTISALGPLSISQAAEATGLPRQTVSRMLFFLEELGYVSRRASDKRFALSERALALTSGAVRDSWVGRIAIPEMERLCRDILWPVVLAQPRLPHMEILWDTDDMSPLVMRPAPIGLKIPMLSSMTGRTYLAFCSPDQRESMISAVLGEIPDALDGIDLSRDLLSKQLDEIRERGYVCGRMPHKAHSSLAVPLFDRGNVTAVLDIRFPIRALSPNEAAARFSKPLRDCADNISSALNTRS